MTAYTNFRTMSPESDKTRNEGTDKDIRSRQIDELIRQSEAAKQKVYGPNWDDEAENFYNLQDRTRRMPTFRPRISAPQLQLLLLAEAGEISDANIRVFIHKNDARDKDREKAFQEHWRKKFYNLQLLMGQVYAQFSGCSFLVAGYEPNGGKGKGEVWMRAMKQTGVHCDPISPWPEDWTWQCIEMPMYLDQARKKFYHTEDLKRASAKAENVGSPAAGSLEMPSGPMSVTMRGVNAGEQAVNDGPVNVRFFYCLDATMRPPTDQEKIEFKKMEMPIPEQVPAYPNGRWIVDAEGTILLDDDSWLPLGPMWPAIPIWATPPWDTVWCPPPTKYTKSLQDAAEQQMTQTYENAKRLNNGMIVINEATGLTANSVGGLPGEIVVIGANSPQNGIEIKYPNAFPPQMIQLPMEYLKLQKELRGQTPARQGNMNPGNVGPDLFEAAVSQSQSGTRLTARLFAWSVQRATELTFYLMGKCYDKPQSFRRKTQKWVWNPIKQDEEYEIEVDEDSIRPMSQQALRSMVIELKKVGMIDVRHALDFLNVPDADEIAEAIEQQEKLMALAKGIKK